MNKKHIIIFILIGTLSGCRFDSSEPPELPGLTVLGLDGATWDIIDPLIARGELPGFARLKTEGFWGELQTIQPTESIAIWTSIATGVSPSRHRVQTFTRRIPGTDQTIPSPGTDRKVPALWDIFSRYNHSVACVKWFATWPAEKVNGVMLSPRLEEDAGGFQTYPPELFQEISPFRHKSTMDQIPSVHRKKMPPPPPGKPAAGMLIGQKQVAHKMFDDTSVWEAGQYVYEKYQPDLFMIYLKSIDRVEHFLWGAQNVINQENATPEEIAEAEAIFGWYRYFDTIIQSLLKDENRILIVVSDHGMSNRDSIPQPYDIRNIYFDRILEATGFLVKTEVDTTDWNRTQAYTARELPFDWSYEIKMNLLNREPAGIVTESGREIATRDLETVLREIKTSDGKHLFQNVTQQSNGIDLIAELNRNITLADTIFIADKALKLQDILNRKGLPRGIHTDAPPGIFAAVGPGIKKSETTENLHVFDITPTILHLMKIPVARDLDGRIIRDLFEERGFQEPERIDTFGIRDVSDQLTTSDADNRMKAELKALGYI